MNVLISDLPETAWEGDYLPIEKVDGEVLRVALESDGKAKAEKWIQAKLDRLRRGDHHQDDPGGWGDTPFLKVSHAPESLVCYAHVTHR